MAIHYLKTLARLEGHVGAEDAESLQQWLREGRRRSLDLGRCESLHTAVLQTLLALRPAIKTAPPAPRLCQVLGLGHPTPTPTATSTRSAS